MAPFKPGDRVVFNEDYNGTIYKGDAGEFLRRTAGLAVVRLDKGEREVYVYEHRLRPEEPQGYAPGTRLRVTLEGTVDHGGFSTPDLSTVLLKDEIAKATKVEVLEVPEPPYEPQKGDVVRLVFSNGEGIYTFDGTLFKLLQGEDGLRNDSGQTPSRVRGMIRGGVRSEPEGRGWRYGGELLARDGAPV